MKQKREATAEFWEGESESRRIDGVVIGVVRRLDASGSIFVDYQANPSSVPLLARSTVLITTDDCDRNVALMFEEGNPERPMIMGFLQYPKPDADMLLHTILSTENKLVNVKVDDKRLTITAEKEIVLRCGKASITLTRAGKVLIRGTYLLSRSSGVNRIKGGSVEVN
jgi:Domain of unknown function (DUF6484)